VKEKSKKKTKIPKRKKISIYDEELEWPSFEASPELQFKKEVLSKEEKLERKRK
jgi:hypothetical protein